MSVYDLDEQPPAIERLIAARTRDLGGFSVRRILPHRERRMVGPFVFFDHMGPTAPGAGLDVRPHPHIGLATVTYLFEGAVRHRDSLGYDRVIRPGDVNWMTAGRGIVHSERSDESTARYRERLLGIQAWIALPVEHEDTAPAFVHHPRAELPAWRIEGGSLRLIAGEAYGRAAPTKTFSPMFYAHADLEAGAELPAPPADGKTERAFYVADGAAEIDGCLVGTGTMAVLDARADAPLKARDACRVMLLGGAPLAEKRYIWWNFVSSSKARIEQAKRDWKSGAFGTVPGDDLEFIPLPDAIGP